MFVICHFYCNFFCCSFECRLCFTHLCILITPKIQFLSQNERTTDIYKAFLFIRSSLKNIEMLLHIQTDVERFLCYCNSLQYKTVCFSRMSCKRNKDCQGFTGNFWDGASLNRKIYGSCQEYQGNCVNFVCK